MDGASGKTFYHHKKDIQVITELAKNLQEHTTSFEEALNLVEYAIELRPRWVTPRRIKAMIHLKLNQVEQAEAIIDEALEIKEFSEGYLTKGDVMEAKEEWKEAERLYRRALDMKRDSAEAKMSVAHSLIENLVDEGSFHEAELL